MSVRRVLPFLQRVFVELWHLLCPEVCIVCRRQLLSTEMRICQHCIDSLETTGFERSPKDNPLTRRMLGRVPFRSACSVYYFRHGNNIRHIIHAFKYNNEPEVAVGIGRAVGQRLVVRRAMLDYDYMVPIPLHPRKQKKRGYNQSFMIAKGIQMATKIPVCDSALLRIVNRGSQTSLNAEQRALNVKGNFAVTAEAHNILRGRKVMLVDDVFTTGSTAEACYEALRQIDGIEVGLLTVGYAQH